MIIRGSAVRQQRLACDWRMGTGTHVDFLPSSIGILSSPGPGEVHVIQLLHTPLPRQVRQGRWMISQKGGSIPS
jgi:hypothetical protein